MKFLVCSDIHGSRRAGEYMVKLNREKNFDKIIVLGDFLYNGPRNKVPNDYDPNSLINIYNSLKEKIIAVRGNCDADVDLMVLDFKIPKMRILKVEDYTFYLTHGDDENIFNEEPNKNEIYLKGHTHLPLLFKNDNGGIVLNPGSMTFPKGKLNKSFIIIDDNDIKMYEFDYNSDDIEILRTFSLKENEYIK